MALYLLLFFFRHPKQQLCCVICSHWNTTASNLFMFSIVGKCGRVFFRWSSSCSVANDETTKPNLRPTEYYYYCYTYNKANEKYFWNFTDTSERSPVLSEWEKEGNFAKWRQKAVIMCWNPEWVTIAARASEQTHQTDKWHTNSEYCTWDEIGSQAGRASGPAGPSRCVCVCVCFCSRKE